MKITILTLFPQMIEGFIAESIIKRAQTKGAVTIDIVDIRNAALDNYGTVDGRPYGGGAGMVLRVDVLHNILARITDTHHTILTSAKGQPFTQKRAHALTHLDHIVILAGHYEGVDERIMAEIDEEISLGDYILTGGELAAAVITDAVVRLLPGVLKKEKATAEESFYSASINRLIEAVGEHPILQALQKKGVKEIHLLEYPQYTRPEDFEGNKVPAILLSGDPKKIERWQLQQAFYETFKKRPDLLA